MELTLADIVVIAVYFAAILFIGFYIARRKEKLVAASYEDYLLAGRKVTLPLFVGTLVATWYGNILGVGEFVYSSGVVAWVCFGLPYYFAAAIFAFFIAGRIRNLEVRTIPEQLEGKYGRGAGIIGSVIILIITIPAAYILMLGVLLQIFTGWPLWISIVTGTVLSLAYIYTGGFKADILTNSAQFVFMYLGFGALFFFAVAEFGFPGELPNLLPADHQSFFGGFSWQVILAWWIISLQTFVDPSFHQRCAASKDPRTARNGILISICCWMVFDFLTLMAGLYAKAYFDMENPLMAFPEIGGALLPSFWKGLFVVALLSTVMSTLDSYAFLSAATIGNDILKPIIKMKGKTNLSDRMLVRIGLLLTGVFGILMAVALPSAVQLIYKTASIAVPGLLAPLVISYSRKFYLEPGKSVVIMLVSASVAAIWTFAGALGHIAGLPEKTIFSEIEPMLPGIFVSLILAFAFIKKIDT